MAQTRVLVDHIGYESRSPKDALVLTSESEQPRQFQLVDATTGKIVVQADLRKAGGVAAWGGTYWTAEFSSWQKPGRYEVRVQTAAGEVRSSVFAIDENILERNTLSDVIYYFKGQRSSGLMDQADRRLPLPEGQGGYVDVHGGWYDATGDYGIHLSHQNPSSYFNPQQVPLVAWSLLKSYVALKARGDDNFTEYGRRLLDEGLYGADFLVRMKRPGGSFFQTIVAPGPGKLPKDRAIGNPNWRTQIKKKAEDSSRTGVDAQGAHAFEASLRSGAGMAVAALALASTMEAEGEFPRAAYLTAAKDAFGFLADHNRELLNDGVENILDDYCALLAATELYRATREENYLRAADQRAASLMSRLTANGAFRDYWRADGGTRPFFHPSDAGLPVISLLEYASIATPEKQKQIRDVVRRSLQFEMKVTGEVNNPFGYARQLVRMGSGEVRTTFFFPHDTEAAPWWQGENARLASLAAAARQAAPLFSDDREFQSQLEKYAWNQLHWILGRNPFDASMLGGHGHGQAPYMFFKSWKYTNAPGGIVNGITAALDNPDGIAWDQGYGNTGKDDDWRWTEQWLPHAAWYMYAIALPRP